jgi:N-acetyl-alpha-D-glucosaminyl L-malate synthase BshA
MADWMLGGNQLRLVTTLHGTDITLVGSNPAYRRAVLFGLEHSQLVTAVSESLAADTRSRLHFEGKIEVIPNFVDPGSFAPGGGARWPERPDGPRELVHLSTFRPVKRVLDLCRAVELLAERLPLRLTLVGDGPELQEALQWCSERGLGSVVRAVGMVEDPAPYLRDSDLYVFSSETESFGLGVLEAMACAVPVVGPRVGGVPEVVGDAGCLVEPNTPEAIAAAAHKVLTDHDGYRRMSALARERALADFPPERAVERYLAAYEAAL